MMSQDERVTRRNANTRRAVTTTEDNMLMRSDEGAGEYSPRSTRRRVRRKSSVDNNFSILCIERQAGIFLRRSCGKSLNTSGSVGLGLALFVITSLSLVVFMHSTLSTIKLSSTTRPSKSNLREQPVLVMEDPEKTFSRRTTSKKTSRRQLQREKVLYEIIFQQPFSTNHTHRPKRKIRANELSIPDYGNLTLTYFEEDGAARQIMKDPFLQKTDFRHPTTPADDDVEAYHAFDDDIVKSMYGVAAQEEALTDKLCRRTTDHMMRFPNCNNLHEMPLIEHQAKFLGNGAFRAVVGLTRIYERETENVALKDMKLDRDLGLEEHEYTRVDAIVAERLSASPRIYDIYGYCGIGILSEFFPYGDMEEASIDYDNYPERSEILENAEKEELVVYNDLKGREKLRAALQMSEALADLHGFKHGVIVHQDVQLSQFLLNKERNRVKLNDFNRAEFMLWDEEGQQYCKYGENPGHGTWRSPEEYYDWNLDEKIDVFSVANNFYGMLTGLEPFYDEADTEKVKKRVQKGEKAYIDPRFKERSLAEAKLAEIIDRCHEFEPEDRPSIFEVVEFLRAALKEVDEADSHAKG